MKELKKNWLSELEVPLGPATILVGLAGPGEPLGPKEQSLFLELWQGTPERELVKWSPGYDWKEVESDGGYSWVGTPSSGVYAPRIAYCTLKGCQILLSIQDREDQWRFVDRLWDRSGRWQAGSDNWIELKGQPTLEVDEPLPIGLIDPEYMASTLILTKIGSR
jgi:hypothetical protein